ncbi:hypothetical protein NE237_005647 [Protea cynaroides]|uniref:Uncharacterized protein n=1 Tax=Protea cynaroides TaxID=273540 RepID=A0A9Q0KKU1_9MAGN|nr:hypothetical protein NE237_005647 [Protea cynaroides]
MNGIERSETAERSGLLQAPATRFLGISRRNICSSFCNYLRLQMRMGSPGECSYISPTMISDTILVRQNSVVGGAVGASSVQRGTKVSYQCSGGLKFGDSMRCGCSSSVGAEKGGIAGTRDGDGDDEGVVNKFDPPETAGNFMQLNRLERSWIELCRIPTTAILDQLASRHDHWDDNYDDDEEVEYDLDDVYNQSHGCSYLEDILPALSVCEIQEIDHEAGEEKKKKMMMTG